MPAKSSKTPRRATHSLEQILSTAIEILDREGSKGLTLRRLAGELGGGLGSIYWYVDGKDEMLSLACDALVGRALVAAETHTSDGPALETDDPVIVEAIGDLRRTAMALFDQTQIHPWLAPQLHAQGAATPNSLRYWERLGRPLARIGLTPTQQFNGSTALSGYVTGVAAEMSAQDLHADPHRPKAERLDEIVSQWLASDPDEFSWLHSMADEFRRHDDDEQFAAGLDLLLGGLVRQALARSTDRD
ncbi:TetR/AcrR family transcriptional regulator [Aeromicrobium sp. UC242_57]|uniref:TetR/AcrR family transcriptional regulator n=1 Tax=Aeromicrobium sp. UC242_57 TaxID=3374624 RepID=UPI00379E8E68